MNPLQTANKPDGYDSINLATNDLLAIPKVGIITFGFPLPLTS